jgi:hypothetical protein
VGPASHRGHHFPHFIFDLLAGSSSPRYFRVGLQNLVGSWPL